MLLHLILIHKTLDKTLIINISQLHTSIPFKRVLIDHGSSAGILYYDMFESFRLDLDDLKPFQGSLVGLLSEQMQVKRPHLEQRRTLGKSR